ncbi:MAG: sirohydrochlorin cobaltochelatase [Solidesulfovibrio sp.]
MPGGIILAAHGSKHPGAMAALDVFRDALAVAYPGVRVELARTVGRKHGNAADFGGARRVGDVLAGQVAAGIDRVVVQSLHVVPGEEYHEMLSGVRGFLESGGPALSISVGAPLLADLLDVERVTEAVLEILPGDRTPAEGVVLMGHGAPPPGAGFYQVLRERLARRDTLAHFGTMPRTRDEPCHDVFRIRDALVAARVDTAWLVPFFSVAGAHACSDLAGDKDISWRGVLTSAGIRCRPLLFGLIEREPFAAVWRDHLEKAVSRLPPLR